MPQIPVQRIAEIRTIDDTRSPADNTGTDDEFLSEFAYALKQTKGTPTWRDPPPKSLQALFDWIPSVAVTAATTGNIALSGLQAVDGVSVTAGQWVLAKNQTTATERGIYLVASGAWTRVLEFSSASGPPTRGFVAWAVLGTSNARTLWMQTANVPNLGAQVWEQIGGGGGSVVDATEATKGITRLSVAPVSAPAPIAVGDNDARMDNPATTGAKGHARISTAPASGDPIAVATNYPPFETHLSGLNLTWVSGSAVTVKAGSAWIPGLGTIFNVPSDVAKTGLTWTANTLYHLYLFSNSGTPDVLFSTTAPVPYKGWAMVKSDSTSHRYIGSVRSDGAGTPAIYNFSFDGHFYRYLVDSLSSPFLIVSSSTTSTFTTTSAAGFVPPNHTKGYFYVDTDSAIGCTFRPLGLSVTNFDYLGGSQTNMMFIEMDAAAQFQRANDSTGGGTDVAVVGYLIRR